MPTCHRHYPGRSDGACSLVPLHRQRPSLCNSQVGSCDCCFGACSAFTHVMACTLAGSPSDPFHRKLRQLCYRHCRFDCYRVERTSSRAGVAPAEVQRLFTAHYYANHVFQLKNAVVLIYLWEPESRPWSSSRKGCSNTMATAKSPVAFGCTRRTLPRTLDCVPVSGREATPNATSTVEPSGIREALESKMPPRLMFSERVCNSLSATLSETGRCRG